MEKLSKMRENEISSKSEVSETFASFESNFLGKTFSDAPIFLNDSNKELHRLFAQTKEEITNPYKSIILWSKSQALDLEAITEVIQYYQTLRLCIQKLEA